MNNVIAMKLRGVWAQTELTEEVACSILKHDTAFEEILIIKDGKLKRLVRSEPDGGENPEALPDNPASPQNTPQ